MESHEPEGSDEELGLNAVRELAHKIESRVADVDYLSS